MSKINGPLQVIGVSISVNKSVFCSDKESIQGYSVYDVVQSSLELIKEIK